jgi:hypothetical protein
MKPYYLKIILCFIAIFSTLNLKAQYIDYVITNNGDTIRCTISSNFWGVGKYKNALMKKAVMLNANEIKEFYKANTYILYRSVFKPGKYNPQFVRVFEKGDINLYGDILYNNDLSNWHSQSVADWYIVKGQDNRVNLLKTSDLLKSQKDQKNGFVEMIKDNRDVYNLYINDRDFSIDELRGLIHLYNTGKWIENPTY